MPMHYFKEKLNIIFKPYLLVSALLTIVCTFIRWCLIRYHIPGAGGSFLNIPVPFVICILVPFLFLTRRIRILKLPKGILGYMMIAGITMTAPVVAGQLYISRTAYDLVRIRSVDALVPLPYQRYYRIDEYTLDTMQRSVHFDSDVSGKNHTLYLSCNVLCPIVGYESIAHSSKNVWWYLHFDKTIRHAAGKEQQEEEHEVFADEVLKTVREQLSQRPLYFENMPEGSSLTNGVVNNTVGNLIPVVLTPCYTPFDQRASGYIKWIFICFGISSAFFLLLVLPAGSSSGLLDRYERSKWKYGKEN